MELKTRRSVVAFSKAILSRQNLQRSDWEYPGEDSGTTNSADNSREEVSYEGRMGLC